MKNAEKKKKLHVPKGKTKPRRVHNFIADKSELKIEIVKTRAHVIVVYVGWQGIQNHDEVDGGLVRVPAAKYKYIYCVYSFRIWPCSGVVAHMVPLSNRLLK